MPPENTHLVPPEGEAVLCALSGAKSGDIVAIFYEKLETVVKAVHVIEKQMKGAKGLEKTSLNSADAGMQQAVP